MTRALPFTTLKDINADLATASEAIDDAENVYLDESAVSIFATPRCPRNGDGFYCTYLDAVNPDRCIYCGQEFAL